MALSFTSFFAGAFFAGGFFAPGVEIGGGGGAPRLRRGRIPKKYSDIDLEAYYRKYRGEYEPPDVLVDATQGIAEALADPSFPEVTRDELADTLIPFMERATQVVNWIAVVKDRQAMQKIIQLHMDANDDDDDMLLLTVH